ncbi:MAG: hypothetical protein ABL925_19950, partial [Methylococcales bacterium]
ADLEVDTWYANWDDLYGNGLLTYEIFNIGGKTVPAGWGTSLILMGIYDSSKFYILAQDTTNFELLSGERVYRDDSNAKSFNIYYDFNNNYVPQGIYYMILFVDSLDEIVESDELNNLSFSQSLVYNWFGLGGSAPANAVKQNQNGSAKASTPAAEQTHQAYNGRHLPSQVDLLSKAKAFKLSKVKISSNANGVRTMQMLKDDNTSKVQVGKVTNRRFSKTVKAQDVSVFPVSQQKAMPTASSSKALQP